MKLMVSKRALCALLALSLSFVYSGVSVASASEVSASANSTAVQEMVLSEKEIDDFSQQTADSFVTLFRDVIKLGDSGYYIDNAAAVANGFAAAKDQLNVIVDSLNGMRDNPYTSTYSTRSWISFGECVVSGVLGFSPFQIDYNKLGKYIYEKAWNKVADLLKKYAAKELKKKAGNILLKQIIKSTPAGFAAWLGVYAVGCAAKEAWHWFRG